MINEKKKLTNPLIFFLALDLYFSPIVLAENNFEDSSIRVVRPRYFNKSGRLELGAQLSTVMNETFIYTLMMGGIATYHFTEKIAIEGLYFFGFSSDKEDKRILFDKYDIKTQIYRTQTNAELAIQWSPIYGKWQLPEGRLVYFDTFLQGGFGQSGIQWKYSDFCDSNEGNSSPDIEAVPANTVLSYPTYMVGIGQRYFFSRKHSYRIDLKFHRYLYNTLDGDCTPISSEANGDYRENEPHDILTLHFGTSYFF